MRRTPLLVAALVVGLMVPAVAAADSHTGNGAPQGSHDYQLNIIGTSEKNPDMDGNNGHRIFVSLDGKSKINLVEGDYAVLDANGTDKDGATFQLPAPGVDAYEVGDPGDADVESSYSVFIRPLGKPGGMATMTTCADVVDSELSQLFSGKDAKVLNDAAELGGVCSLEQVGTEILTRDKGKSTFTNVTAELTTILLEIEVSYDDTTEVITLRVPIFDDLLENEYWEYDNKGLRLAQVRFYDCSTNVDTGESINC